MTHVEIGFVNSRGMSNTGTKAEYVRQELARVSEWPHAAEIII